MKRIHLITIAAICLTLSRVSFAQHTLGGRALQLDNGLGKTITLVPPAGLLNSYIWTLPLNPPPPNSAFSEAGSITGQVLRWDNALGYWVASSTVMVLPNGDVSVGNVATNATLTLEPGSGGTVLMNNIANDNTTLNFLTIDASNRVRYRTLNSFLGVSANEGLVYDVPNIKLGGMDATTNPFASNRFVNLNNKALTFTYNNGISNLLVLQGSNGNLGVGTTPNTFKVEVAGNVGPSVNNIHSLGSNSIRWKDVFVGPSSVHIGNGSGDQTTLSYTSGKFNIDANDNGSVDGWVDGSGNLEFNGALMPNNLSGNSGEYLQSTGTGAPVWVNIQSTAWTKAGNSGTDTLTEFVGTNDNEDLYFRTNKIVRARFRNSTGDQDSGAFEPYLSNVYNLGTASHRWHDAFFGPASLHIGGFISGSHGGGQDPQSVDEVTISYTNGQLIIDKPLGSTGSMVPNNSDVFTLGSNTSRWADLFLGGSSLHIGSSTVEATISYDTTNQILKFNTNGSGPAEVTMDADGNVTISSLAEGGLLKADPVTGLLAIASGGADFEAPLTFTNGLTRTENTVSLGGALDATTTITTDLGKDLIIEGAGNIQFSNLISGLLKVDVTGIVGVASPGEDFQTPLTFTNGLTNTSGTVTLGGSLTGTTDVGLGTNDLSFSGTGRIAIGSTTPADGASLSVGASNEFQVASTGEITTTGQTFTTLADGLLKVDGSGIVGLATADADYMPAVSFSNGLNYDFEGNVKLGGTLTNNTEIPLAGYNLLFSGTSGNIGIGDISEFGARLDILSDNWTGLHVLATGASAGNAAAFANDNASNANDVVYISSNGTGSALSINSTAGNGVYINTSYPSNGLVVNSGSVVLSQTDVTLDVNDSYTFGAGDNAVVTLNDDATVSNAITVTLTAGTPGQILYIFNGDASDIATVGGALHGSNTGPLTIAPGNTLECIYITNGAGSGWITK